MQAGAQIVRTYICHHEASKGGDTSGILRLGRSFRGLRFLRAARLLRLAKVVRQVHVRIDVHRAIIDVWAMNRALYMWVHIMILGPPGLLINALGAFAAGDPKSGCF